MRGNGRKRAALFEESLAIARQLNDSRATAIALQNLAYVAQMRGQYGQAQVLADDVAALWRQRGDNAGLVGSLLVQATVALTQDDMARTTELAQQSLRLCREMGAKVRLGECLERLAFVACKLGCPALAAERLGSATALREMLGVPIEPRDREVYESITRQICHQLGEDHFRAAWTAGQERPLDQVIVESLSEEVHEDITSINP